MPTVTFQVVISGHDAGGYAWENVHHVQGDPGDDIPGALSALANDINTNIVPPLTDAMVNTAVVLNIATRALDPDVSYTFNLPINAVGARAVDAAVGALAGVIQWLPSGGVITGRSFINNCGISDFVNDVIDGAYLTLLEALASAWTTNYAGAGVFQWQVGIFNKSTSGFLPIVSSTVRAIASTLNKRMRA